MGIVEAAVEDLEKAKSKLDDLRFAFEENERWDLAEALEVHIEEVQSVIDSLTDDELFASKPVEGDDVACDCGVICDHAESCTQKKQSNKLTKKEREERDDDIQLLGWEIVEKENNSWIR